MKKILMTIALCLMSAGLVSASETCLSASDTITLCNYSFTSSPTSPFWTDSDTDTDAATGTYAYWLIYRVYKTDGTYEYGKIYKTRGDGTPGDAAWYGVHSVSVSFSGTPSGHIYMVLVPLNAYDEVIWSL